jgi:SAM-dependent methyltransferase
MNSPQARLKNTTTQCLLKYGAQSVKGKVLDINCGDKPYKRMFPDCEWVGMDNRPVGDVVGDPHRIPFDDNTFDTVLCLDVLQYCQSPMIVIGECARVLKPGGTLIVSAANTFRDNGVALWDIKMRGMEFILKVSNLLDIVTLTTEGKLFSHEWSDEFGHIHESVRGFIERMDSDYPQTTFAVVTKKEE